MRGTLCLLWTFLAVLPLSAQVRTETLIHTFDEGQAKAAAGESARQSAPIALGVAGPPFVAVTAILHYAGPVDEATRIWLQASADGRSWDQWIEVQADPHIEAKANRLYGNLVFFPAAAHYLRYRLSPPTEQALPLKLRLDPNWLLRVPSALPLPAPRPTPCRITYREGTGAPSWDSKIHPLT